MYTLKNDCSYFAFLIGVKYLNSSLSEKILRFKKITVDIASGSFVTCWFITQFDSISLWDLVIWNILANAVGNFGVPCKLHTVHSTHTEEIVCSVIECFSALVQRLSESKAYHAPIFWFIVVRHDMRI